MDQSQHKHISKIFNDYSADQVDVKFDFAIELVKYYRKSSKKNKTIVDINPLIQLLQENKDYKDYFISVVDSLVTNKDFDQIITDSGIINYSDFSYEVKKRIADKILPYQPSPDTLEFTLNQLFYSTKDPNWLEKIPREQLYKLLEVLEIKTIYNPDTNKHAFLEIIYALEVLTQRVTGRALESDISKMVPDSRNFDSPFIGLQREMTLLIELLREKNLRYIEPNNLDYKQLFILLAQCEKYIDTAYSNAGKLGISLKVNQSLLKVRQQLKRIETTLYFIALESQENANSKNIDLIYNLIKINCKKTNVIQLINEGTQAVAYEITQHKANTGEHYITASKKEYNKMFWSACAGGAIVAVMCIIKLLLSKVESSAFGHAFYYSMNYSIGFIAIYLLGGTLATKQPSMTASALASSLERKTNTHEEESHRYWTFATFFSQLFRSQFIAFVGNIIIAFPVAFLLIWGIDILFSINIANSKWHHLLEDLNPVESPAIFHACIAGVFLFLSGIIAGNVANKDKFNSVYYRIQEHPLLKLILGKKRTSKFAEWYKEKWAGIISNFWFGVFMGSTGSLGIFLGLDIDVRHITFASGNMALGLFGSNYRAPLDMMLWASTGTIIIGFFNFIVSFSLSFYLAIKARKIKFNEIKYMFQAVWALFKVNPKQFFLPPKSPHE